MLDNKKLSLLESGFRNIGEQIVSWRNDKSILRVTDISEFKTIGDAKAHQLISDLINSLFENVVIISEEDESFQISRPESYWLIDPIDGTASWYEGYAGFVTQAAYIHQGQVQYGIVLAPATEECWTAVSGKGAYYNGRKIISDGDNDSRLNLIDNYPEPRRIARKIADSFTVDAYIECGSFGKKCCMVADQRADVFAKDVVYRDWDVAPAMVILKEAGAHISDFSGNPISLNGSFTKNGGLLVARKEAIAKMIIEKKLY